MNTDNLQGRAAAVVGRLGQVLLPGRSFDRHLARLVAEGRVTWGRHTYGTPDIRLFEDDPTRLHVGAFSSIGAGVTFLLGGNHPTDRLTTYPFRLLWRLPGPHDGFPSSKGDITVGSDVWIGHGCTIVSGASIGDGAIIGAGSLVAGTLPPYTICAGTPARPIKPRFDEHTIAQLLELRWWELDDEQVRALVPLLSGDDPQALIARLREVRGLPAAG